MLNFKINFESEVFHGASKLYQMTEECLRHRIPKPQWLELVRILLEGFPPHLHKEIRKEAAEMNKIAFEAQFGRTPFTRR